MLFKSKQGSIVSTSPISFSYLYILGKGNIMYWNALRHEGAFGRVIFYPAGEIHLYIGNLK